MKAVAQALDDEFFGRDSHRMKQGSFAMLCHAVIGCRTLRSALARAVRFYNLILDDTAGAVAEADGMLRLEFRSVRPTALFAHENLTLFRWRGLASPFRGPTARRNIRWCTGRRRPSASPVPSSPSTPAMALCRWCATRRR
jgi:hypothetical protein